MDLDQMYYNCMRSTMNNDHGGEYNTLTFPENTLTGQDENYIKPKNNKKFQDQGTSTNNNIEVVIPQIRLVKPKKSIKAFGEKQKNLCLDFKEKAIDVSSQRKIESNPSTRLITNISQIISKEQVINSKNLSPVHVSNIMLKEEKKPKKLYKSYSQKNIENFIERVEVEENQVCNKETSSDNTKELVTLPIIDKYLKQVTSEKKKLYFNSVKFTVNTKPKETEEVIEIKPKKKNLNFDSMMPLSPGKSVPSKPSNHSSNSVGYLNHYRESLVIDNKIKLANKQASPAVEDEFFRRICYDQSYPQTKITSIITTTSHKADRGFKDFKEYRDFKELQTYKQLKSSPRNDRKEEQILDELLSPIRRMENSLPLINKSVKNKYMSSLSKNAHKKARIKKESNPNYVNLDLLCNTETQKKLKRVGSMDL